MITRVMEAIEKVWRGMKQSMEQNIREYWNHLRESNSRNVKRSRKEG